MSSKPDVDVLLASLKEGADPRRCQKLDALNTALFKYVRAGGKDFRIATVSRIALPENGPKAQSIRNKEGEQYRRLIEAWATLACGFTKSNSKESALINATKRNCLPTDDEIINRIQDPVIRGYVNLIVSERNLLLKENKLLKSNINLTYDHRNDRMDMTRDNNIKLDQIEIEALEHAISNDFMNKMGWSTDDFGRVKAGGTRIYKAGYITAIKNILLYSND